MKTSIMRIDNDVFELRKDEKTQCFVWVPAGGYSPMGGVFNTEKRALDFARDRIRQLGGERAALAIRKDYVEVLDDY